MNYGNFSLLDRYEGGKATSSIPSESIESRCCGRSARCKQLVQRALKPYYGQIQNIDEGESGAQMVYVGNCCIKLYQILILYKPNTRSLCKNAPCTIPTIQPRFRDLVSPSGTSQVEPRSLRVRKTRIP